MLQYKTFVLGPLETNCYVLWNDTDATDTARPCWLIDPGMWPKPMTDWLEEQNLQPEAIFLTHGHGDHIGGVEYLKQKWPNVKIHCPTGDAAMLTSPELNLSATFLMGITSPEADISINAGDTILLGEYEFQTIDTSGHTLGGVSYYCPTMNWLFTGDALFYRSIGRTDIPNGDHQQLIENIQKNLLTLPAETTVFPGHGPQTTITQEASGNPYL